jgi:hydroxymethylpyrimidine/phosphomethylpyrimidine kinase
MTAGRTPIALTIAGSDSGGCAGIQADIKTFSALGVFGASAITAVTAQNTLGVRAVEILSPGMVGAQIDAVLDDLDVAAVKIGMVADAGVIAAIVSSLAAYAGPVIVDPVMVASSGDRLLADDAVDALRRDLLPRADLVTPNLMEAALLSGRPQATDEATMESQARAILAAGAKAVLIKGGHSGGSDSTDLLVDRDGVRRFEAPRIATRHDHGTGCTLAAAIAAECAKGQTMGQAVAAAKDYLHGALQQAGRLTVGSGRGPVHHFHHWWPSHG